MERTQQQTGMALCAVDRFRIEAIERRSPTRKAERGEVRGFVEVGGVKVGVIIEGAWDGDFRFARLRSLDGKKAGKGVLAARVSVLREVNDYLGAIMDEEKIGVIEAGSGLRLSGYAGCPRRSGGAR